MILNTLKCVTKSNYKGFLFKKTPPYIHKNPFQWAIKQAIHFLLLLQCQKAAPWPIVADKRSPIILCILAFPPGNRISKLFPSNPHKSNIRFQTRRDLFLPKFLDWELQFFSYTLNSSSRAQSEQNLNSAESKPQAHVAVPAMVTLPPAAGSKFTLPLSQHEWEGTHLKPSQISWPRQF